MAQNVIRQDIIQLDFITNLKELTKINKEVDELKKAFKGGVGDDALEKLKNKANEAVDPLEKVKKKAKEVSDKVAAIGKKAAKTAFNGLKKLASISFKALTAGITGAATAVAVLVKNAVSAYSDYEQLYGGMQTLLGAKGAKNVEEYAKLTGKSVNAVKSEYKELTDSEKYVMKNANNAFKTAGMSANQYMETITTFAASMKSSVGGDAMEAAKLSDMAIQDMADNANKMGTPLENVSIVYSNLARDMYMTLDNLKLGYAGTKEGAKQLVNDAAKIDKSVKANDISYANLVKAIHAVQVKMDIYKTTQKEAFGTIQGSMSTFKAAWGNLLPAIVKGGDELDLCIDNLVDSIVGFKDETTGEIKGGIINNLLPATEKALKGVGTLIERLTPTIEKQLPKIIEMLLPPLIKAATSLLSGLIKALPTIVKALAKEIPYIFKELGSAIQETFGDKFSLLKKFGDFCAKNQSKIKKLIPVLLGLVGAFMAFSKIKSAVSVFSGLFGKSKGGDSKGGGNGGGLFDGLAKFAKAKPTTILKGIANLAIILGGLVILTAAIMALSPYLAKLTDMKSFVKLVTCITILGLVGTGLAWLGELTGKIPITTVLKGLANMAIMLVGFTALAAAFMFVAPYISGLSDIKTFLKLATIVLVLGVVGMALTYLGSIAGVMPIKTVLLGLANMAIVLVGFTALAAAFMFVAPYITAFADLKQFFALAAIITVLGAVGMALTIFAGIAGLIPIPIVLAGLANMALVIGGITGLIIAYGKLSEAKGFNDFITKGGEALAKLFNIIGKIGGSLIGGIGEGIANSLPAIGESIGKFGENIKPLFAAFNGADMSGVGTFFKSLGAFMLQMAGEKLLTLFTGDINLADLGKQLNTFAENSSGFFTKVAEFPENGFTNGTKLFDCLAGMKSLPKDGGVVGWFTGSINYENLANGLYQLSSEKVKNFFIAVAELKQAGFDNAKSLFDCLAGLKSLPKKGGVVGWFCGDVNYTNIANGLAALSRKGVSNFFTMVGGLEEKTFTNMTALFKALGSIGKLPKEGGWWDKLTGKETTTLGNIATELGNFSKNAATFFELVNNLNLDNLNGLWASLKKSKDVTANMSKIVSNNIDEIVDKISKLPQKMGDALRNNSKNLSNGFVDMWEAAVKASVAPVNKLLDGANHILKEFGSEKSVISWKPYAKGTKGHKGGNALVNDGRGAELVQMPNGNTFIPRGKNVFIPNAPKGMKVLPAEQTAKIMGRKTPTYKYANGVGDIWDYIDNASGLVSKISDNINYDGLSKYPLNSSKAMVSSFSGAMTPWVKKLFEEAGALSLANYNPAKGVKQWRTTVSRALKMEKQYSIANVARTLYQMQTESGGNPKAINLWDSNAKKGIPSKGLMQVIDPTFRAYARTGFDKNIYDPLSNILASIRYAVSRYGSLAKAYRGTGYANGGIAYKPSIFGEDGAEMAIPLSARKRNRGIKLWQQTGDLLGLSTYAPEQEKGGYSSTTTIENNTYAPQFTINISGTSDDRATARKVKQWVAEAMDEVFTSLENKKPKLREV